MASSFDSLRRPAGSRNAVTIAVACGVICAVMIPNIAVAQDVANTGILDNISASFAGRLEKLGTAVGGRAQQLLLLLLAADMVLSVGRGLIADEPFAAMVQKLVMRVVFVAIVLFFIQNVAESTKWLSATATQLGGEASGENRDISPKMSEIFKDGFKMALRMLDEITIFKPLSVFYIVCAFCVLLATGVMLATFLIAYIELYVVALAGMIVLGFAGLETSKDSVATYVRTLIGQALKLMALLLVYFIMTTITLDVVGESSSLGQELVVTIVILQVVTVLLLMTVPASVASLSGGIGASRAAEAVGGAVASVGARTATRTAQATAGASLGAVTGAFRGAASAKLGGGAAASAASFAKSVGKGALSGAGRAGSAGAFRNGKIRAELAKDIAAIFKKGGDA